MTKSGESTIINHNRQIMSRNLYPKRNSYIKERGTIIMTKIKNTKKGMAKKTLSMSLVVAMLATSNVPVWAAEFSDGTDAAFTSEADAPVVEGNTADAPEAQSTGDVWTVKLDKELPTSVAWGNSDSVTGNIKQTGVENTSVTSLKYTWKNIATGLATDAGNAVKVDANGKFTIALPSAKDCVGNSYTLFMWDNNGDWTYTSSAVAVVAKNIKDAGATVTLKTGAKTEYTGKEVKADVNVKMPADFETTGKYSVDYTGTPDLVNKGSKVTVTVTVTNSKLYTGTVTTEYTIGQKTATAGDFKLSYINNSFEYTGSDVAPKAADIRVQDINGKTIDGAVKTVTPITASKEVGSYEANAEIDMSKFENYSGTLTTKVEGKYNVVARDLSKCTVTVNAKPASTNNKAVTLTASDLTIKDTKGNILPLTDNDVTVTVPANAIASGTYTVTIGPKSGTKNVTGSTTATLTLYASDISDAIELDATAKTELAKAAYYTGSQITKDTTKFNGHIYKKGTTQYLDQNQYTVEFGTNVNAGTNAGIVRIVGKNTYAGSVKEYTFDITPATIKKKEATDVEYKEGATYKDYAPTVTITAENGDKKTWTLKEGTDYTVTYAIKKDASGKAENKLGNTVVSTIKYSKDAQNNYGVGETDTVESTIVGKTLTSANIKMDKTSYDYTGKAIVPEYKVYDGDKLLKEGTDYEVKNTIGGKEVGEATLVIVGKGNYNNKVEATTKFNVVPVSADKVTVTYKNAEYTGESIQPKLNDIDVKLGDVDVKSQFQITGYGENINAGKEAGSLVLTPVKDNKNFTSGTTKNATFDIAQAKLNGTIRVYNANGIELTGTQKFTYDGKEKTFAKVVFTPNVVGNKKVTSDDYEIQYVNNTTGAGGAKVIVIAKGNYKADGTAKDLSTGKEVEVKNVAAVKDFTIESKLYFTEKEVTVTDAEYAGPNMVAEPTIVVRDGDKVLVKDKDYTVVLSQVKAGTAPGATNYAWTVKGKGVYAGSKDVTGAWKIVKKNVANLDIKVDLDAKGEAVLTVMNGNLKVDNKDFTVKLSDDKKTATVAATAGNQYYVGSKDVTVGGEVVKVGTPIISNVKVAGNKATVILFTEKEVTVTDAEYAGPNMVAEPTIVVRDGDKVLVKDKDYTVVLSQVKAGTAPGATNYAWTVKGKGVYAGSKDVTGAWKIVKKNVANLDIKVDLDAKGEAVLTVMNGNLKVDNKDFTVKLSDDKKTATVAATAGNQYYVGSKDVTVGGEVVKVGTPIISNVKVAGNKATVILSGEADGAVGYDYVISTDRDCIKNKNYDSISKNQVQTSTTFKYVQQGTYYAYCHAWKRDENGKKVFGEWSNAYPFSVTSITPDAPVITNVTVSGSTIKVTYKAAANATGYDVVLGTGSKKENGETRPYQYGNHKKLNLKEGTVTATFKKVPKGTWVVGMHAFNRTSEDGKKVFSPWSNLKKATVK